MCCFPIEQLIVLDLLDVVNEVSFVVGADLAKLLALDFLLRDVFVLFFGIVMKFTYIFYLLLFVYQIDGQIRFTFPEMAKATEVLLRRGEVEAPESLYLLDGLRRLALDSERTELAANYVINHQLTSLGCS